MKCKTVNEWKSRLDMVGAFGPLSELVALLDTAPKAARKTKDYEHLKGLIHGRLIHEKFGGINTKNK